MSVPFLPECIAVSLYHWKKEIMKEPKMAWVFNVEKMYPLKPSKKCPPATNKLCTNLHPHTFNARIMG
jgi:hypothetical protein